MSTPALAGPRLIRLRYPGTCRVCAAELAPRAEAFHDPATKRLTCTACGGGGTPAPGQAGGSAQREADRRHRRRVENAQRDHGAHAAAVAEVMAVRDPNVRSWAKGSDGERRLAGYLEREVGDAVIPLYDRLIPGLGKANIDLLYVTAGGVWVVDAKDYTGVIQRRTVGPLWRQEHHVIVGGRDRTGLAAGVERQADAVRAALATDPELAHTPVEGALCFVGSDWGLFDRPFQVGAVWVLYAGALRKRLRKHGPLARETMERVARRLDLSLPPA